MPVDMAIFRLTSEQYNKGVELAKALNIQSISLLAKRLLLDKLGEEQPVDSLTDTVKLLVKRMDNLEQEIRSQ